MLKLTFIADTHHYSKTLGTTGKQYELRSGSDQKCLAETGDIIDSAFKQIAGSDTDYVLIAGDVSNDGELASHLEFREKLVSLAKHKKVFLITATHDWCCDQNPRRYADNFVYRDVPTLGSDELYHFYSQFGIDHAISKFKTHIGTYSYVVQLSDNVRLLALNDDKNENNHAGFAPDHFDWIDEQLKKAKDDGCLMIGMEHHLLYPHINPLITGGGTCVENREYVASRLADNGLRYTFVGHSHMQKTDDFVSAKGNKITEINVASLVGYPASVVNVTVNDDFSIDYQVDHVQKFTYQGVEYDAQEYLATHCTDLVHNVLKCPTAVEFGERISALNLNGQKISRYFGVIKPFLNMVYNGTVSELYKKLKFLGLAKNIDVSLVAEFADKKVVDFVDRILLSVMDGSRVNFKLDDSYYKLVMSFVRAPEKFVKSNENYQKFLLALDNILTGGQYNNQYGKIEY